MARSLTLFLGLLLLTAPAEAGEGRLRLRAREHLQFSSIRLDSGRPSVSYFTPAASLSLYYEVSKRWMGGLVFQFGAPKTNSTPPTGSADKMSLKQYGLEGKWYAKPDQLGLYGRFGLTYADLNTKGFLGRRSGGGYYLAAGWEQPFRKVGLALELGFRHLFLEDGGSLIAFTPAIGVHFYLND